MGFVPEEKSSLAYIGDQLRRLNQNIETLCDVIRSNRHKKASHLSKDKILNKQLHCSTVEAYDREVNFIEKIERKIRGVLAYEFTELPPNDKLDEIFQYATTIYIASHINHVCNKISLKDAFNRAVLEACKNVGLEYFHSDLPIQAWDPLCAEDAPCQEFDELIPKNYGDIQHATLSDMDEILAEYYPSITITEANLIRKFWKSIYLDVNKSLRNPLTMVPDAELGPGEAYKVRMLNAVDHIAITLGIFDPNRPNEYDTCTIFYGTHPTKAIGIVEGFLRRRNCNTHTLDSYNREINPGDYYFTDIRGHGMMYAVVQETIRKGRISNALENEASPRN